MAKTDFDNSIAIVARWLIGGFFVYSAIDNLLNLFITAERLGVSIVVIILAALFKFTLGSMVMMRYHTKYASLGLALYLASVSLLFYNPFTWSIDNLSQYIFIRNVAIIGGLLYVYSFSRGFADWQEEFRAQSESKLLEEGVPHPPRPLQK